MPSKRIIQFTQTSSQYIEPMNDNPTHEVHSNDSPPSSCITLNLNGVDFQLQPDDSEACSMPLLSMDRTRKGASDEYSIRLNNFCGVLRVSTRSANKPSGGDDRLKNMQQMDIETSQKSLLATPSPPTSPEIGRKMVNEGLKREVALLGALPVPKVTSTKEVTTSKIMHSNKRPRYDTVCQTESKDATPLPLLSQKESRVTTPPPPPSHNESIVATPPRPQPLSQDLLPTEHHTPTPGQTQVNYSSTPPSTHKTPLATPVPVTCEKQKKPIQSKPVPPTSVIEEEPIPFSSQSPRTVSCPTTLPSARWGHTLTQTSPHHLVLYGGQDDSSTSLSDISIFNLSNKTWSKPVNCSGAPRTWHTSTFLPHRQLLISFGGESRQEDGKIDFLDKLMVLDTEIMLWYPPVTSGTVPSGRSGHSASLLPDSDELVIFGGVKGNKWLNSLAVLDTTRWKWCNKRVMGDPPQPRSYHSSTAVGSYVVIFGGNDQLKSFDSVHVLDMSGKWTWMHPNVSGRGPRARTGHSATLLPDGYTILIYGGWDPMGDEEDDEDVFEDAYMLDTKLWSWREAQVKIGGDDCVGATRRKRVGHESICVDSAKESNGQVELLIFGGRLQGEELSNDFQSLIL